MNSPLVDITTINAVESLFRQGIQDPWAKPLSGQLADLVIYSDTIRYSLPVPGDGWRAADTMQEPSLLVQLADRDSEAFKPQVYSTEHMRSVDDRYLYKCFDAFEAWAKANSMTLRKWINLHNEPWIRPIQGPRAKHGFVFNIEALSTYPNLDLLAKRINVRLEDLCYAFDVVLRFPLYGSLTGGDEFYLNHPIRDAFQLPTMHWDIDRPPKIAVPFRNSISELSGRLSQDEYTALVHELRGIVRDMGLNRVGPGECDKDTIREIAAKVGLIPHLSSSGKIAGIVAGLLGGLAAIPSASVVAAIAGVAVSISSALWKGSVPAKLAKVRWLRWALKWDIEEEIEQRI